MPELVVKTEQREWVGPPRSTRSGHRSMAAEMDVIAVDSDDEGFASAAECDNSRRTSE